MLGERTPQRGLFEADHLYLDWVGQETFYGVLASLRGKLFRDEDFACLYCPDNGRRSVPPSVLATALLLQAHDGVSDAEATARARYDVRWKVALGVAIEEAPFAKSTLQLFRAQLILHDQAQTMFLRSLEYAREMGCLQGRRMKVVLDTTTILGRGAVKDTYNLLADGIKKLAKTLARRVERVRPEVWAEEQGLGRYFGSSIKGQAEIDWDDEDAGREFLRGIVQDADRLLAVAREAVQGLPKGSEQAERIREAAGLLVQLLWQDIERQEDGGPDLKRGVAKDRIVSVHDPDMRHGRKSSSKRSDGHKLAIVVETESQVITAVEVLPGNAPDRDKALELVEESEQNTGMEAEEAIGDCAYGDGMTRQQFEEAGRKLVAKVAPRRNGKQFSKDDFEIDLAATTCRCRAGQVTAKLVSSGRYREQDGQYRPGRAFQFSGEVCDRCELRPQCTTAGPGKGRTVALHPQERLLQEARALQNSPRFREYNEKRQVAEHRLARLVQLGVRQARYFGRRKTLFQVRIAATVANLTLVAAKAPQRREDGAQPCPVALFSSRAKLALNLIRHHLCSRVIPCPPFGTRIPTLTPVFG
jgi:hypothetical protein